MPARKETLQNKAAWVTCENSAPDTTYDNPEFPLATVEAWIFLVSIAFPGGPRLTEAAQKPLTSDLIVNK